MYCSRCGSEIPDSSRFCPECGQGVDTPPTSGSAKAASAAAASAVDRVAGAVGSVADKFNEATGGTGHVKLKFKDFFVDVFKHHTHEEADELFICGTPSTTPDIKKISGEWPKPWLYSRVLVVLLITLLGCMALWQVQQNPNAFPGVMFIGALMVPFSVLVFFFETNVPRNICISQVVKMFFVGGVGSILLVSPLSMILPGSGTGALVPAMLTGIIEEVAKIAMVVYFMSRTKGKNYILNGLLIGAAVGAGFAVFESAGYACNAFIQNFSYGSAYATSGYQLYSYAYQGIISSVGVRAVLAIGGHVAWAAAEGAALAICEKPGGFNLSQLKDVRFLIVTIICVVLHGIWDMYVPFLDDIEIPIFLSLKLVILIVAIWVVLNVLLGRGLAQINDLASEEHSDTSETVA